MSIPVPTPRRLPCLKADHLLPGIQPIDETLAAANARRIADDYAASFTANQGWIFVIANLPGDAPAALNRFPN